MGKKIFTIFRRKFWDIVFLGLGVCLEGGNKNFFLIKGTATLPFYTVIKYSFPLPKILKDIEMIHVANHTEMVTCE